MLPYSGAPFLVSFVIPLLVDAGVSFYVPFDTPFKFIVSSFFLLFQMHHGGGIAEDHHRGVLLYGPCH